ncbi:hypothetical protein D3C71_1644390 [compost metagenome]
MRIGVENAVLHDHLQHCLRAPLRQHGAVKTGLGRQRRQGSARRAVNEVLHVDALARVGPVHARDHDVGQRRHVGGNAFGLAAFAGQVQLASQ